MRSTRKISMRSTPPRTSRRRARSWSRNRRSISCCSNSSTKRGRRSHSATSCASTMRRRPCRSSAFCGSRGGPWRMGKQAAGCGRVDRESGPRGRSAARINVVLAERRRRAHRDSAAGGDRYHFAFDGSLDEIAIVDPKSGRILDVNATFVQRSGFARAQVLAGRIDSFDATLTPKARGELESSSAARAACACAPQAARRWRDVSDRPARAPRRAGRTRRALLHVPRSRRTRPLSGRARTLGRLAQTASREGVRRRDACCRRLARARLRRSCRRRRSRPMRCSAQRYSTAWPGRGCAGPLQDANLQSVLGGKEIVQLANAWRSAPTMHSCASAGSSA